MRAKGLPRHLRSQRLEPSFQRSTLLCEATQTLHNKHEVHRLSEDRPQVSLMGKQPHSWASLIAQLVKNLPAMQETLV